MAWWDGVPALTAYVDCSGSSHRILWSEGTLAALDHGPDLDRDAEAALSALGGPPVPCLLLLEAWENIDAWTAARLAEASWDDVAHPRRVAYVRQSPDDQPAITLRREVSDDPSRRAQSEHALQIASLGRSFVHRRVMQALSTISAAGSGPQRARWERRLDDMRSAALGLSV